MQFVALSHAAAARVACRRVAAPVLQHNARLLSSQAPAVKPSNPNFGSGPCTKRPGFTLSALDGAALGRSHRSSLGKTKLKEVIERTRSTLEVPQTHRIAIVPASDTGAFEMAMWSMLGERPVDCFYWESFGKGWANDLTTQLKLADVNVYEAGYGKVPDFSKAHKDHDVVFTANGTTSGARVPADGWGFIADDRTGVTLCDATSAVYAQAMPWPKLDVTTFSWQKVLGGEGAHGMLIASEAAAKRIESFAIERPLPKIFRMAKKGALDEALFEGSTINTPSMLAVEDCLDALKWVESVGGLAGTMKRSDDNLGVLEDFVGSREWINFLVADEDKSARSNTSVCLTLKDLTAEQTKWMINFLASEEVAFDIGAYRDAPAGLRIWCGATIEAADLEALMPWLEYAYFEALKQ